MNNRLTYVRALTVTPLALLGCELPASIDDPGLDVSGT